MNKDKILFYESIGYPFIFVIVLWLVKFIEKFYDLNFVPFGILPRKAFGLIGIFTGPLIHGNFNHLLSNTLPLLILGMTTIYFYRKIAFEIFFWVYLLTGIWVWTSADGEGFHIGASGLIYGFASFLFFSGMFRKELKSLILSLLVIVTYGGLVWGMLPFGEFSWESHFFGALSGAFAAYFYRNSSIDDEEESKRKIIVREKPGRTDELPES